MIESKAGLFIMLPYKNGELNLEKLSPGCNVADYRHYSACLRDNMGLESENKERPKDLITPNGATFSTPVVSWDENEKPRFESITKKEEFCVYHEVNEVGQISKVEISYGKICFTGKYLCELIVKRSDHGSPITEANFTPRIKENINFEATLKNFVDIYKQEEFTPQDIDSMENLEFLVF